MPAKRITSQNSLSSEKRKIIDSIIEGSIERTFTGDEKKIMWIIREYNRRYRRRFPKYTNPQILRWFYNHKGDPRNEEGWKKVSNFYYKLKGYDIDLDKYIEYIFGTEKFPRYYFLGSDSYLSNYLEYILHEYKDSVSDLDEEKEMIIKLLAIRNLPNEEELFKQVPAIIFNLSKEYLVDNESYKKLKETGWFDKYKIKVPF